MKTLYFEGAGMRGTQRNDVENCRIRTAFTNDNGNKIYIELLSGENIATRKKNTSPIYFLWCDHCHYITDDQSVDDCNVSRLKCERNNSERVEYTKENILKFVNQNCNCSFDNIVILDRLSGYRVHADTTKETYNTSKAYHYGDQFSYDPAKMDRILKAETDAEEYYKKVFGVKYAPISINNENGELKLYIYASDSQMKNAGITERNYILTI